MTQRNIQGQATPGGGEKRWEVLRSGLNDTAKRSPPARPPPSFIARRSLQWAPAFRSLPPSCRRKVRKRFSKPHLRQAQLKEPRKAWPMTRIGPNHLLPFSSRSLISASLLSSSSSLPLECGSHWDSGVTLRLAPAAQTPGWAEMF